jgi:hypothetical protein
MPFHENVVYSIYLNKKLYFDKLILFYKVPIGTVTVPVPVGTVPVPVLIGVSKS